MKISLLPTRPELSTKPGKQKIFIAKYLTQCNHFIIIIPKFSFKLAFLLYFVPVRVQRVLESMQIHIVLKCDFSSHSELTATTQLVMCFWFALFVLVLPIVLDIVNYWHDITRRHSVSRQGSKLNIEIKNIFEDSD